MKDSELEAILKQAISDDTEVPKKLNEKLMRKISAKRKKSHFPTAVMKYAAAAAIAAVGVGALVNGGYFSDKNSNETDKIAMTDKGNNPSYKNDNPNNSQKPTDTDAGKNTDTDKSAGTNIKKTEKSTSSEAGEIKNKSNRNTAAAAAKKNEKSETATKQNTPAKQSRDYIVSGSANKEVESANTASQIGGAKPAAGNGGGGGGKGYKYLEIAAENIGKALESLNVIANDRIDEHYSTYTAMANGSADTMMFSMINPELVNDADNGVSEKESADMKIDSSFANEDNTRSMKMASEDLAEESSCDKPEITAGYVVMADTKNYYSVRVDAETNDRFADEYSAYYTVDKNKDSIVTLDDIYSDVPQYRQKLYNNICSQMTQRMEEDKNTEYYIGEGGFESITGDEDFYLNNSEEVVITYRDGTVAPYGQGKSEFNVGTTDELNKK